MAAPLAVVAVIAVIAANGVHAGPAVPAVYAGPQHTRQTRCHPYSWRPESACNRIEGACKCSRMGPPHGLLVRPNGKTRGRPGHVRDWDNSPSSDRYAHLCENAVKRPSDRVTCISRTARIARRYRVRGASVSMRVRRPLAAVNCPGDGDSNIRHRETST